MSTSACVEFAASKPRRSSRKTISQNFFGGAAIACVVLGCGWTVYANILTASIYPTLGSARYDEPVIKSQPRFAARYATEAVNEVFAALPETAPMISKPMTVASITPTMFNERFAASEAQGVASNAANASPPSEAPKLAEAPKETSKTAAAPKLAEAPKPKEAAPASAPVKVAALPVLPPPPAETKPAKSPGSSVRDMAQRAKAAVMSIASNEKRSIFEKLWGKQASQGSLLAYASADASITGSLGQNQNPALGGSAPYDRSTAVYDISAHMVYLPDGTRLEAHSGLGDKLDDPGSAKIRMRGVTPPHIYELKPREALFHGVPALRLTPIGGEETIYGRSGLLAHTFMLGPNGDSNGCVSFRDYNAFLNAYRNQGIKRLAVVARVE
jgi:cell division protein FtsN